MCVKFYFLLNKSIQICSAVRIFEEVFRDNVMKKKKITKKTYEIEKYENAVLKMRTIPELLFIHTKRKRILLLIINKMKRSFAMNPCNTV